MVHEILLVILILLILAGIFIFTAKMWKKFDVEDSVENAKSNINLAKKVDEVNLDEVKKAKTKLKNIKNL